MTLPTITRRTDPVPRHDDPLAQAGLCSVCPKLCRPACPVQRATGRESAAPWRISDAVVTATASGWTADLATRAAQCTGCLACAEPCLPGTNLPEESRAARAAAASAGAPLPAAVRLRERIAATPPSPAPRVTGVFAGCDPAERCCGAVAFDLGLVPEATALAASCAASLPDEVVVASPGCARMIREEWPLLGVTPPRVTTAPEWLATLDLPRVADGTPVAWHAPCVLTRALGVVTEPVDVLTRLGYEVREPAATGVHTRCSGAGAAYPLIDPSGAAAVAAARREELAALDAPVVTACPAAARALGGTDLLDLVPREVWS